MGVQHDALVPGRRGGIGESTAEIGPRMAAVPIVLDAAYAVVLVDLLAADEVDLLLAPWDDVVGSPFGERPDAPDREDAANDEADEGWPPGDAHERVDGEPA